MSLDTLSWDSKFFKMNVGSYQDTCPNSAWTIPSRILDFDLVYLNFFCDQDECCLPSIDHTFDAGTKLTFSLSLSEAMLSRMSFPNIRQVCQPSLTLKNLVLLSGHKSRFKQDPGFSEKQFRKLYLRWMTNCLDANDKTKVLGYFINNSLSGFITVESTSFLKCRIGLVAVAPEHQGKGIGNQLILGAIATAQNFGASSLTVQTQGDNHPAIQTYINAGFKLTSRCKQLHWWNPTQRSR